MSQKFNLSNSAVVYQTSGAGNWHFCNLLARREDHINIILKQFFTRNVKQSCYGCVKSTGGRCKNSTFHVYIVKNDRNRHEMMQFVVLLYVLVAMCARKVQFLPQPPVDLVTALTAVYGIFR